MITLTSDGFIRGTAQGKKSGAHKNLNVAIVAPLYHAQDRVHRSHRGIVPQQENLTVYGVLLIWIRRKQMKYAPLAIKFVDQGPCQIKWHDSSFFIALSRLYFAESLSSCILSDAFSNGFR